jgi:hypothetical protein
MSRFAVSTRMTFCLFLIFFMIACGGAGAAPSPAEEPPQAAATEAPPAETILPAIPTSEQPGESQDTTPEPAIPETRRLTLEYPPRIRAGDSDVVRLTLEVDQSGNITPTAVVEGHVITGDVIEIPNLYETHYVIAEARFDVAGIQVSPPELTSQTLSPGQTVRFFWSIRPEQVGTYRGTVWLYLRFVDKVSAAESQKAVSAQIVEIEAVNLFGIPANVVRIAGGAGSVIGSIIGFPFFEDIVRLLFKRKKKGTR